MVKRVELYFISWELMRGWMANFGSAQGGRPHPLNAKTRAQTRIFRPPEQKVDVCARVLTSVIPGRRSRRSIATRRRPTSSVRKGTTGDLFALCHMHEALVHVQTQKQALLREEHRIGMERSRGVGRAPLPIARVFDRQPTIRRRGNATAQQEEHSR